MFDPIKTKTVPSEAWLRRVADEEDQCQSISVGGLVTRLGMYPIADEAKPMVFGELVNLIRRKSGLSIEQLALLAKVDACDVERVERSFPVVAGHVYRLADALKVPADKMAQLAGVSELTDHELAKAAERFESRLRSPMILSPSEESALNEFMETMHN